MSLRKLVGKLNIAVPADVDIKHAARKNVLDLQLGAKKYSNVVPEKPFPISHPEFVILKDEQGSDICTIRDISELDEESGKVLEGVLEKLYFIPKIARVLRLDAAGDRFEWVTETERGRREFTTRGRMSITFIGEKMVISDAEDNLYQIENINSLDDRSRRMIESTF
jgi:hypothetical protein